MDEQLRVLHVDDEPDFTDVTASSLEREEPRLTVETATSASEGLELLATHDFDCVVADYDMPGRNGLELLGAVRDVEPALPFILFTGKGSEEVASEAISAGVTDYIQKRTGGDSYTLLANRIRNAVERYHAQRAIEDLHEVATDLAECTTREEVYQQTVEAAASLLQLDSAAVVVEEDGLLQVKTTTDGLADIEQTTMSIDEGVAGKTYRTGESFLIPDVGAVEEARPQTEMNSAMSLPIGNHGVFQVIDRRTGAFDGRDLELAKLLVRHTESALDLLEREQELERQNERLDEFASVVSHDLRNPLNVADLRLDLASRECDSEHLDDVADALDRSQALLEDLRTLARNGETVHELDTLDLRDVVDACWRTVTMGEATLTVAVEGSIRADRSRLQQLLENLFRNAVEHGGEDVTVTVGELDTRAGFYVADDGPGIPADKRDPVFERGYTTSTNGTGFGLAIVRRIAEAHDWEVAVKESEDGGARFEITGVEFV